MRIIELDAEKWRTVLDLFAALLPALGAPEWHGESLPALIDSMIWGEINAIEPPYTVRIVGTQKLPTNVRDEIKYIQEALARAREEFRTSQGHDIEVNFEIKP